MDIPYIVLVLCTCMFSILKCTEACSQPFGWESKKLPELMELGRHFSTIYFKIVKDCWFRLNAIIATLVFLIIYICILAELL